MNKSVIEDGGDYMAEDMLMHARKLERERDEIRQLYDLDVSWLKAENAALREALESMVEQHRKQYGLDGAWDDCIDQAERLLGLRRRNRTDEHGKI